MLPGLEQLVVQCAPQVAPQTTLAIIRVESAGNPWALGVNGSRRVRPRRAPASRDEAQRWAAYYIAAGYSVDMGLMQVNSTHLRRFGLRVEDVFEPCQNIATGGRILSEFYGGAAAKYGEGQGALKAALSAYNTGNHQRGVRNGYVGKVSAAAWKPFAYSVRTPVHIDAASAPTTTSTTAPTPASLGEPLVYRVKKPGG
jgi:type IV secretion system protein VirB1